MTDIASKSVQKIDADITAWIRKQRTTAKNLAGAIGMTPASLNNKRLGKTEWTMSELQSLVSLGVCEDMEHILEL